MKDCAPSTLRVPLPPDADNSFPFSLYHSSQSISTYPCIFLPLFWFWCCVRFRCGGLVRWLAPLARVLRLCFRVSARHAPPRTLRTRGTSALMPLLLLRSCSGSCLLTPPRGLLVLGPLFFGGISISANALKQGLYTTRYDCNAKVARF